MHGREQRVDPREHGDLARLETFGHCAGDDGDGTSDGIIVTVDHHPIDPGGGTDDLGHAANVVLQQRRCGTNNVVGASVVDLERVIAGKGEVLGKVDEPLRVGTIEAVDGLIVIADPEHAAVRACQETNHQQVSRSEVLELVDEQHTTSALRRGPSNRIGEHDLDRGDDLLVEVERTGAAQLVAVARQHGREPIDITVVERLDVSRIAQPQSGQR